MIHSLTITYVIRYTIQYDDEFHNTKNLKKFTTSVHSSVDGKLYSKKISHYGAVKLPQLAKIYNNEVLFIGKN